MRAEFRYTKYKWTFFFWSDTPDDYPTGLFFPLSLKHTHKYTAETVAVEASADPLSVNFTITYYVSLVIKDFQI